jgi:RNA polymerase sigma-70 factor (ECF subfamily)
MDEPVFDMETCLRRVLQGEEAASRELMDHLYPLVVKVVRAHLPRRTGEEDLCQMIFIKIFTNLQQYSGRVPLEHWVSRIAVNTCLNALKAEQIRPELRWADLSEEEAGVLQALQTNEGELDPGEALASRELVEVILATLNPEDRLIVNLLHIEGHTLAEASQITGWNIALVKVRAFRARLRLKNALNALINEGNP